MTGSRADTAARNRAMVDRLRNQQARAQVAELAARGRGIIPPTAANEVRNDVVAAIERGDAAALTQLAAEAAASDLRGTAELARSALGRLRTKEEAVSIRFIEPLDIPPPTQSQRDEQEKRAAALAVERQRVEREAVEREREQQELARLRAGGETSRQRAAKEYIQYLNGLQAGRWVPHGEEAASRGTVMDDGRALMAVDAAAKEAAIAAVAELLAAAETELERADEERQQVLARGHL